MNKPRKMVLGRNWAEGKGRENYKLQTQKTRIKMNKGEKWSQTEEAQNNINFKRTRARTHACTHTKIRIDKQEEMTLSRNWAEGRVQPRGPLPEVSSDSAVAGLTLASVPGGDKGHCHVPALELLYFTLYISPAFRSLLPTTTLFHQK